MWWALGGLCVENSGVDKGAIRILFQLVVQSAARDLFGRAQQGGEIGISEPLVDLRLDRICWDAEIFVGVDVVFVPIPHINAVFIFGIGRAGQAFQ